MTFFGQAQVTCQFITRTRNGVDSDGNDVYSTSSVNVPGCLVAPGDANGTGGNEILGSRDTVLNGAVVYAPPGWVPTAIDAISVPGPGTFEVDGTPAVWPSNATGFTTVIRLRSVTG